MPEGLSSLISDDGLSWKNLVAPRDITHGIVAPPGYSSYVYRGVPDAREPDANLIFAYEREPWSRIGFRMFPDKAHAVCFGNGRAALLRPDELKAALEVDADRRKELNLPLVDN